MHLVLDTVLCCHPFYCFAAATSFVWVFQINDQQVKWTPPIQNVYRSVTNGWPTIRAALGTEATVGMETRFGPFSTVIQFPLDGAAS
jgi:hypothetical protein